VRVLIVDDEHLARLAMRRLLGAHPEAEIVGEAASLPEAIEAIERTAPQLVFLDIELGGGGEASIFWPRWSGRRSSSSSPPTRNTRSRPSR
jgi:DNA-binding NarL/FixJ family response regulator